MVNFKPLKNCSLFYIDSLIKNYKIKGTFLDAGGGLGDVSEHLSKKGFKGKMIDFSEQNVQIARKLLEKQGVKAEHKDIFKENGKYDFVLLFDVLEHIQEDEKLLKKISSLTKNKGYLLLTLPMNHSEWRWDDAGYGHYRRYSLKEIKNILHKSNFELLEIENCSFPLFWLMRRVYTCLFKKGKNSSEMPYNLTKKSARTNLWDSKLGRFLEKNLDNKAVYYLHRIFKKTNIGFEFVLLARKKYNPC